MLHKEVLNTQAYKTQKSKREYQKILVLVSIRFYSKQQISEHRDRMYSKQAYKWFTNKYLKHKPTKLQRVSEYNKTRMYSLTYWILVSIQFSSKQEISEHKDRMYSKQAYEWFTNKYLIHTSL